MDMMALKQTTVLLLVFVAVVSAGDIHYSVGRYVTSGGCDSYTCGVNARCTISEGRRVCSCLNFHVGDPLTRCVRLECQINEDCSDSKACINNNCVDPCPGFCGINARCDVKEHFPVCSCPTGYIGDPIKSCQIADPQAACKPNPCGPNTSCEVVNDRRICSCLPGYQSSLLGGCRHECESDRDCPNHLACSSMFRCESPCNCGTNAHCDVFNHRPKCSCPNNWLGNPHVACLPECTYSSECLPDKPVCLNEKCINPCDNACGINANCRLKDAIAVCSCPRNMTGNPFISCRPFEPRDLCEPNPCGIDAICTPGHDKEGNERPVCTCPTGYFGNALHKCRRGECLVDNECPDNKSCISYSCQNPCTGKQCGSNAICDARRHLAICTCPEGTRGDALISCEPINSRTAYGRYILH